MYTIYEIIDYIWPLDGRYPGRIGKVGVTDNVDRRAMEYKFNVERLVILEVHDDIYKVSDREIELQREKGYPIDKVPYYVMVQKAKLSKTPEALSKRNGSYKYPESGKIKKGKVVYQYSKDGTFIKEHLTLYRAAESVLYKYKNLPSAMMSIQNCIYGKGGAKSAGGYVWKYA